MNRKLSFGLTAIAVGTILVGVAIAQVSTDYDVSWSLLSGGGGSRSSGNYRVDDSLGQWAGGRTSSANTHVDAGFWYGAIPPEASFAGDSYELDDTCGIATTFVPNDPAQSHTFHDAGDQDWITFDTLEGKTYVIETSNVGTDHDAVLFLYGACDAPDLGSEDNAFGQTVRLEWNSAIAGTYYLMLQQHDPGVYGDQTSYDVSVTVDTTAPSAPRSPRSASADQALILQWKRSPELDVVGYNVCFGTISEICSGVEQVDGGDTTYYELTGLTNEVPYYLSISAVDFSDNESPRTPEIANVPGAAADTTAPSVTVSQPTSSDVYTTALSIVTISGSAADLGGNLSRVRVSNLSLGSEGWDYSLSGTADTFFVGGISLGAGSNDLQVTVYDDAGHEGADSVVLNRVGGGGGAVIIVAGQNDSASLQTNINNAANRAYQVFQGAGFSDDDIYYLARSSQDPDGDGSSEVDATATPANLQSAITTWAAGGGRVGAGKPLHLYMMDHGLEEYFCTSGCKPDDRTSALDLNSWLNTLETSTGVDAINVIVEACHSGSFIDRLEVADSISKAGRVIIASTGRTNNAYASAQGAYFSDAFFSCIVESNSLKTCYDQAKTAVALGGHAQTPWLDDNGDGLSNPSDGTVAQNRYLTASFGSFRPDIEETSVTVVGTSGTLAATVERGAAEIEMVWAAIYGPGFVEPTGTTLDLGVPVVLLEASAEVDGLYQASYPNGFAEEGTYRIVFYSQDQAGIHAQPQVEVLGGQEIYLPLVTRN